MRKQVCDLVTAYLAFAPKDEKPLAVEVALEAPLVDPESGEDLGMPLVGVVDLVLDGQGGPVICDFKTAARSSEPMEISHEIQLIELRLALPADYRQAGSRAGDPQFDKDQSAEVRIPSLSPHAATPISAGCLPSSASISMPWIAAGSITGLGSAVRCATTGGSARTGTERRDQ